VLEKYHVGAGKYKTLDRDCQIQASDTFTQRKDSPVLTGEKAQWMVSRALDAVVKRKISGPAGNRVTIYT
jgi:hypothetical protein